ncbi:oxalate:formate antiporter-like isoform X1 [Paramuricea clavata]|uniref:Oxalate:formate antiporter-like isoform X1 n=1 Tax=Paramuricea clavata TaxID=317549 RepID=A0A7D9IIG3_PARCT|nr:oxalate:formate antiporter-like isoform X1 [Paramuricea clavata]
MATRCCDFTIDVECVKELCILLSCIKEKVTLEYFAQPEVLNRVPYLFVLLGGVCCALCSVGALLLFKPPRNVTDETKPEKSPFQELTGTGEYREENGVLEDKTDLSADTHPLKMIKTKYFWILWFLSLVNGEAVIFVSSFYKAYGETFISNDYFLTLVGSIGTGFISVGRIFWGFIADRLPLRLGLIVQNTMMVFLLLTFTLSEKAGKWLYFIWVVTMFGTMAGTTTYLTAATATTFGLKYFSTNYGLVSSSMIFGGILGSILSQNLTDHIGWSGIFALIAGFSFSGIVLSYIFDAEDVN